MAARWTVEEEVLLRKMKDKGLSIPEASDALGRSEYAIRSYLKRKRISWVRWSRGSLERERVELIRQRHVVLKAAEYFEKMKEFGAVISLHEIAKAAGAKAVLRAGVVEHMLDGELIDEAAEKTGYKKRTGRHSHIVYDPPVEPTRW